MGWRDELWTAAMLAVVLASAGAAALTAAWFCRVPLWHGGLFG
jgi:hypothetical protein